MLDRAVGIALQLALVPILAAHWGLERYGVWGMLIALPGILLLSDLGFATAATVRMTMQIARGEREAARTTMHSASQVVMVACAFILLVGFSAATLLPDSAFRAVTALQAQEVRAAILWLTVYAILINGSGLLLAVFRSNERFAMGSLFSTVTLLLENGSLVVVVSQGHGLALGAAALAFGRAGGLLLAWLAAARLRTGVLPGFWNADTVVRQNLLGPALAAMAIPLGTTLIVQGQVVALGLAAGAAAVPAFVASRTLSRLGLQLGQALAHPLMPEFTAAAAHGNHAVSVRYFAVLLASSLIISAAFAALLALGGTAIVAVWSGGHIIVPHQLMLIMALAALIGGVWNPLSNLILAVNQQDKFAPALVILASIGFGVTLALAPFVGSAGAALTTVAIDLAMLLIVMRFPAANWGTPRVWMQTLRALARQVRQELQS